MEKSLEIARKLLFGRSNRGAREYATYSVGIESVSALSIAG
jgi:hypothetical protein